MNKSLLLFCLLLSMFFVNAQAQTGLDCSTAVTAKIGSTAGNGNSSQYFKFTAASTGYINLSSTTNNGYVHIYKGTCNSLSLILSGNCYKDHSLLFYVEAGVTYTIKAFYIYSNNLVIESTDKIGKEITQSYVQLGSDYYSAKVDTVNNTLSYTIPIGFDLSDVTYAIDRLNIPYTTLSVNGTPINSNGKINLETLNSIVITGNDGSTCTYTVTIIQKAGISCSTATPLNEDKVKVIGNGEYTQYYSLTPASTSYYELKADKSYYATAFTGACNSLIEENSDNISSYNSLILYGKAGTTYYIKTDGQKTDSLIIHKISNLPKEFTSFYVYTPTYNYYYANIDTVKNSISLVVPSDCDLTTLNYNLETTANNYNTVSAGTTTIKSNGVMDFSALNTLTITGNDGSSANYSLTIQKIEGMNCATAEVITENSTPGNGQSIQYFSYTPNSTKYIKISTNNSYISVNIYTGNCNALSEKYSGSVYPGKPIELKAEAGITYIFRVYNLNSENFIVNEFTSINKEFNSFAISENNNDYDAIIDTVKNTITISLPSEIDLSHAGYSFTMYGYNLTTVTSNGEIIDPSGNADFNSLTSLLVTGDDGTTQTYSLSIKKVEGMNCSTALTATYGLTSGNGVYNNYFKFTPSESGFVTMSAVNNGINMEVSDGTCDNLSSLHKQYTYLNSPLFMEVENGKTYIVNANGIYNDALVIKKIKAINKEFRYFQLTNNLYNFSAIIDTIANTIFFTIPSDLDLSKFQYYFDIPYYGSSIVSVDGNKIDNFGIMDFTTVKNITITAKDGSTAVYTIDFVKDNSLNCGTPTEIIEGTITGNGKPHQYYSYTPALSGFIIINSTDDNFQVTVLKGECGSFTKEFQQWMQIGSDFIFPVEAGIKYTLLTKYQESNKFAFAFKKNFGMDFTFFNLEDYDYNRYYSDIDTVLNKITFKVPAGFDKTNLQPDFEFSGNQDLTVTANNVTVENDYTDFTNISSLTLTNKDNVSVTYSVIFAETAGADCATASALAIGTNTGNGLAKQYYTFKPTQSGYIKVSVPENYFYFSIAEGTCSNLNFGDDYYISPDASKMFKVEKDKNYIVLAENLKANKFTISYANSVSKEFVTVTLYDGAAYYYGKVDSLAKTVSFTLSSGLDLSLLNYSIELRDYNNTYVLADNDSISNSGVRNFSDLKSLVIKANDGTSVSYNVTIKTTDVPVYLFFASCKENGSISPNGYMSVEKGANLVFTITPKKGYGIKELYVDDELVTAAKSYTFTNISEPHQIYATFEQTTAVKSTSDVEVNVYPNPFKNNLTIDAETGTEVKVFNIQGSKIFESVMDSNSKTINLSKYPQGLYIIEVRKGEKTERFKAIKQ